ncbi:PadR family transcriptional regulator [Hydrogenophaga sp. BPS33]|uniref:PadR family transcriptional regulator n=1 Tax=Hydrogenophaga sp. BPS33 TaxID=2651974 RepID=UPI00131FE5E8|nr:PadR family transcriptional regulator [Hydrogenophaga sp. BPS33]QHE84664.1 PadR family transcriptional regulator [Hydrogenophaga sp. BPS33]
MPVSPRPARKTTTAPATSGTVRTKTIRGQAKNLSEEPSRIPTIGYVILGRLAQAEETGYDLSLFMGPPRNYIWEASHSQIYPLLATLTDQGLVQFRDVPQVGKPNKKIYSITATGMTALQDWVRNAPTPMTRRLEFNAKVNSLWLLPPSEALTVLDEQIAMTEAEIEMINGHMNDAEQRSGQAFPPPPASKYSGIYANIRYALDSRRYMIEWYQSIQKDFRAAAAIRKRARK